MVYSGKNGRVAPESSVTKPFIDLSGEAVVTLEKEARKVTDIITGEVIAENTKEFTLTSDNPHTWLLEIQEK